MAIPERIRSRQSAEVTLESGLKVGITLPNARELMYGGGMAWPVIERMAALEKKDGEAAEALTPEEKTDLYEFQKTQVARMIRSVEGEDVECDPTDLAWLDDSEFYELVAYFMRSKPLPGKAPAAAGGGAEPQAAA
jgi:hypothetical protein